MFTTPDILKSMNIKSLSEAEEEIGLLPGKLCMLYAGGKYVPKLFLWPYALSKWT